MLVSNFWHPFIFCQLPARANQIAWYNRSVFLVVGKTLFDESCALSTTFFVDELQVSTCRLHTRDGAKRLAISLLIANLLVFSKGDGERAALGCLASR